MAEYKTEWVEPSYGCCYMTAADHQNFKDAIGTDEQVFTTRRAILEKYKNQSPFGGDGLYLKVESFEDLQSRLPRIRKINSPEQEEQRAKADILHNISGGNVDHKKAMLNGIPSSSNALKNNPIRVSETKSSMSKRKEEGVKKDSGNVMKSISLPITAAVADAAEKISSEFQDAKNKSEGLIDSVINKVINPAKSKFSEKYSGLKENYEKYKEQVSQLSETLASLPDRIGGITDAAIGQYNQLTNQFNLRLTNVQNQITDQFQFNLDSTIDSLAGAFGVVASIVAAPTGFSNTILAGGGGDGSGYTAADVTDDYPNGVSRDGCPVVRGFSVYSRGQFSGYEARQFRPTNLGNTQSIQNAVNAAIEFANQRNGVVWDDCSRGRFIVFWQA